MSYRATSPAQSKQKIMEVRLLSEVLTKRLKGAGLGAFISLATKWECLLTVCCCYFELPEVNNYYIYSYQAAAIFFAAALL